MSRDGVTWSVVPAPGGLLYEGPHWISAAAVFQWVDILAGTVHRWDPYSAAPTVDRVTGLEFATMALPLDTDRSLVASRSSLHLYSWAADTLETVGEWEFAPSVRFNDGAISPSGEIYVGTMSMDRVPGQEALHRFDLATGTLDVVVPGVGISNGLCWDSGVSAYYVDSLVPQLDRLEYVDRRLERRPWFRLAEDDEPDGLALAADGSVAVALWEGSAIGIVDASAQAVARVHVPALHPTSVAFGGAQGELVLVTTGADDDAPGRVLVGSSQALLAARSAR